MPKFDLSRCQAPSHGHYAPVQGQALDMAVLATVQGQALDMAVLATVQGQALDMAVLAMPRSVDG